MKKFLAIFLALTLVLGLCACGGNGAAGSSGEGLTADGKVKLSIGIGTNALVLNHDNNALTKWVEETCGVELEFVEFSGGTDIATQISTKIGARQELPDILFGMTLNEDTLSRYGQDGYFVDLTPYYEDREDASKIFWDRMENELTEDQQDLILKKITDATTESIYGVPIVETSMIDKMHFQPWINVEWLDKLGLEKPTNTDELYTVLKAFKDGDPNGNGEDDEIPLFGSESAGLCAYVVDWLINMYEYYNPARSYNVDENGKLYLSYTTDAYREGLKFVNKLYKEGLLTSLAWSASGNEMKQIATPSSGTALCGIFLGHLTVHTTMDNPVMYQYEPLPNWGYVVRDDISCVNNTFITENCANPDKAFEVLMTLWSWDGSMRVRYGEYGVNWTDATEGGKSDLGLDATYKLISDPLKMQSTAKWAVIASTLNVYAEGETAEIAEEMTEWMKAKSKMHADSYALFEKAEAENNVNAGIAPPFASATEDEKKSVESERNNVAERANRAQTEFCQGVLDPNSDTDWNNYLAELESYGMQKYLDYLQMLFDRS